MMIAEIMKKIEIREENGEKYAYLDEETAQTLRELAKQYAFPHGLKEFIEQILGIKIKALRPK